MLLKIFLIIKQTSCSVFMIESHMSTTRNTFSGKFFTLTNCSSHPSLLANASQELNSDFQLC